MYIRLGVWLKGEGGGGRLKQPTPHRHIYMYGLLVGGGRAAAAEVTTRRARAGLSALPISMGRWERGKGDGGEVPWKQPQSHNIHKYVWSLGWLGWGRGGLEDLQNQPCTHTYICALGGSVGGGKDPFFIF